CVRGEGVAHRGDGGSPSGATPLWKLVIRDDGVYCDADRRDDWVKSVRSPG
ncbi:hypothetical protein GWI33_016727, partial [Rhynchophorus ferrugineus]